MTSVSTTEAMAMPAEERVGSLDDAQYAALIDRLSRQSVLKHYDAFADIDWDSPEMRIDPDDPRWDLMEMAGSSRHGEWPLHCPCPIYPRANRGGSPR